MRRGNDPDFICNKQDEFCGVFLSADYCAEHECGIQKIRSALGMKDDEVGIERRRVRTVNLFNENGGGLVLHRFNKGKTHYLMFNGTYDIKYTIANKLPPADLYLDDNRQLSAAWDGDSFAIAVHKKDDGKLDELFEAIKSGDAAVFLGGGQVFLNAGLVVAIISKVDRALLDNMRNIDIGADVLKRAAKETGIEEILKKANKKYYALSPRWEAGPERKVVFWLNPMEQKIHNFGWFSVEDLRLWAEDKGPVIKGNA